MELSPETCRVKPLRRINAIVASCWNYFTINFLGYDEIMPPVFGLMAVSRGATGKSEAPVQLIFGAELRHSRYETFHNINN